MSITLDGSNLATVGVINSATAQASTSGTSIDFTGIPSGTKRITVMFNGVSTTGTNDVLVQIGSGSATTSGYNSAAGILGGSTTLITSTAGFYVPTNTASDTKIGHLIITNISGNIWVASGLIYKGATNIDVITGNITLSGVLDRVRITTVGGTDTFDAGSINILYE